ncbi:hypothetical protein [Streptomyces sviceus]|uniref:hypothetical protein n=1 Tax=Streptomyces sviceus TaxID=285530 RepID=UPI003CC8DF99
MPGPRPVVDRLCMPGILYVPCNEIAWRAERGRRTRLVARVRGRLPHPREKGGADAGTPFKVITTAANVHDVT